MRSKQSESSAAGVRTRRLRADADLAGWWHPLTLGIPLAVTAGLISPAILGAQPAVSITIFIATTFAGAVMGLLPVRLLVIGVIVTLVGSFLLCASLNPGLLLAALGGLSLGVLITKSVGSFRRQRSNRVVADQIASPQLSTDSQPVTQTHDRLMWDEQRQIVEVANPSWQEISDRFEKLQAEGFSMLSVVKDKNRIDVCCAPRKHYLLFWTEADGTDQQVIYYAVGPDSGSPISYSLGSVVEEIPRHQQIKKDEALFALEGFFNSATRSVSLTWREFDHNLACLPRILADLR